MLRLNYRFSSGSGNYEYEVLDSGAGTVVARVAIVGSTVTFSVSTADTYTGKCL